MQVRSAPDFCFKARLKKYFNTIKAAEPHHTLEIGKFIKLFEVVFDQELRARNTVNHHGRFEDIAIDKIFLTDIFSNSDDRIGFKKEHLVAYRKAANEWSKRVRARGAKMDES